MEEENIVDVQASFIGTLRKAMDIAGNDSLGSAVIIMLELGIKDITVSYDVDEDKLLNTKIKITAVDEERFKLEILDNESSEEITLAPPTDSKH